MSGIAGVRAFAAGASAGDALREMSELLRHRGPDWSGVYLDEGALLVHERLAIVDPAGGSQPLLSADGQLALAIDRLGDQHAKLGARPHPVDP